MNQTPRARFAVDLIEFGSHSHQSGAQDLALSVKGGALQSGVLQLEFELRGALDGLCIPKMGQSPIEPLWKHTCFEVFMATAGEERYRELNFSPTGHWAGAQFGRYRQRERDLEQEHSRAFPAPIIDAAFEQRVFCLKATVPVWLMPEGRTLRLGLSTVLEQTDGQLQYWALGHTASRPDFHLQSAWSVLIDLNGD